MADNLLGAQSASRALEEQLPPAPLGDNRLTHWQQLFYRYDAWGNLISRRNGLYEQHYVYDADNRLTAAHGRGPQGEFRAQYHYDALGRRTRKQVDYKGKAAQRTRFLWQGYRLLQEQRDDGTRRSWSYEPDSPWTPLAAIEQAGESRQADIFWLHSEQNGAPLEVTDGEGGLRWSGDYDTFGRLKGQTAAGIMQRRGAAYEQPLRYAGQYQDCESGLHYNLFRYYEPEVGRFTTQDPIGLQGGLNLYQYAPNPYGWVDPLGFSCSPSTKLNRKLRALEKAQKTAVNTRHLSDGRIRYYDKEALARTQGPTRGRSHVTEWDPKTGNVRSWEETYNHAGEVNRVHPKMKNGEILNLPHYPPTKADIDAGIATPLGKATGVGG